MPAHEVGGGKGGGVKAGMTFEESLARIMKREIGFIPEGVKLLAFLNHFLAERGESPHGVGRHDVIFLHFC